MVSVALVKDPFEAKLLAARLGAEGIVWELRGNVDGLYPLGPFEVLVEPDALATARLLLDGSFEHDDADEEEAAPPRWSRSSQWVTVLVLLTVVLFVAIRMFSLG